MGWERDPGREELLLLDGAVMGIDAGGGFTVRFVVKEVPPNRNRPHGLNYSLTLHGKGGERLAGLDNAHAVRQRRGPGGGGRRAFDHLHRLDNSRPYTYTDAYTLHADFWALVESVLREKGGWP